MAKLKFTFKHFLSLLVPFAAFDAVSQEPASAGSNEEAAKEASGDLSPGAIAAAVAAAAVIAGMSGDGADATDCTDGQFTDGQNTDGRDASQKITNIC